MHYLYILQSEKDKSFYVGVTNDVKRRLKEHNLGLSKYTKLKLPWKIVRVEKYNTASDAYKRERFIKLKKSKKIIEIIVKSSPRSSMDRIRDS